MKQRQSNIELLRIIAALAVVVVHYNFPWAIPNTVVGGGNYLFLCIMEAVAISAVDVFILITGYFSCKSDNRTLGKPLSLVCQVIIYREIFYLAQSFFQGESIGLKDIVQRVIPNNYFVILFVALYVISPYLNFIVNRLTKIDFLRMLVIFGLTFAVWPWLVELIGYGSQHGKFDDLSSITRFGAMKGYNVVNFAFMYLIGAYIRLHGFKFIEKRPLLVFATSTAITFSMWILEKHMIPNAAGYMLGYHSPFVILQGISAFYIFKKTSFQSTIINKLAGAAFTCFLLQGYFFSNIRIEHFASGPFTALVLHFILSLIGIYLISYIVYFIYNSTFGKLFGKLDKFKIPYFESK